MTGMGINEILNTRLLHLAETISKIGELKQSLRKGRK